MVLNNINNFEQRMLQDNINVAFFTMNYHNCVIEVAYSLHQKQFLFAIQGTQLGFTTSINNAILNGFIENVNVVDQLRVCAGRGRRDPLHFFEHLDTNLPTITFSRINRNQYINIAQTSLTDPENNIFFETWINIRISRRTGQYEKTVKLLGAEVAQYCWINNITPRYTNVPNDRTFSVINDFRLDHQNNH